MKLIRRLAVPPSESHLTVALVLSVLVMSMLLWAVIWQSGVISVQRDLIRALWEGKFGAAL